MISNICISDGNRDTLVKWILEKKKHGKFTVIDVGGCLSGWTSHFIDALVDMNTPDMTDKKFKIFTININDPYAWKSVDTYVEENGKFDFSICTHTLEDISNPLFVCRKLGEISKQGYIAVPSKFIEFARFEGCGFNYRGYIHHRWIFSIKNNTFIGYPKMPFLEYDTTYDKIASTNSNTKDLSFDWNESIPIELINNDFLGPSGDAVISYYKQLLNDDIN